MGISTKNIEKNAPAAVTTKRGKIKALAQHHKDLFRKEGVVNPKFIPRMSYNNQGEKIVGFYAKEIYGEADIYTEFCSREYKPEDPKRTLWKWLYNPEFKTEYKQSDPHPATGDRRYLVPVDELISVNELHEPRHAVEDDIIEEDVVEKEVVEDFFEATTTAGEDVPYADMTLKDYAAIQWQKPVSSRPWLNDLIRENFNK